MQGPEAYNNLWSEITAFMNTSYFMNTMLLEKGCSFHDPYYITSMNKRYPMAIGHLCIYSESPL